MKRKYLLLVLAFCICGSANSQVLLSIILGDKLNSDKLEFGLDGGFNWSQISGLESSSSRRAFNIGFYFDFALKNQWSIYTGVLVKSQLGTDKLSDADLAFLEITPQQEEGTYSQRLNYFLVPGLMRYNLRNKIYLEGGVQLGLMYKASVDYYAETDDTEVGIREFNKDRINPIDAGLSGGIGYRLRPRKGMSVGLRYYYGLTNVYKGRSGTTNTSIFAKVTIPIGANKKEDDKAKATD
jgi:hypothetical protein